MSAAMRILLAVDESENSHRVVQYVGSLLGRTPNVVLILFHVLKPMPRGLLEHAGSDGNCARTKSSRESSRSARNRCLSPWSMSWSRWPPQIS